MSESALKSQVKVVGTVRREGEAIFVPEAMKLEDAIDIIKQTIAAQEAMIERSVVFEQDPYEVAHAFTHAIEEVCGTLLGMTGWFAPPQNQISLEVAPGEYVKVAWGQFVFPFDPSNGVLSTGYQKQPDDTVVGKCEGTFKQKYAPVWERLVDATRRRLLNNSIFRGKTLRLKFRHPNGKMLPIPEIRAWDVRKASTIELVFSQHLENEIEDHIFTPIRHRSTVEAAGIPFKRGVLLAGKYGTGKTELGAQIAAEAAKQNMTVVYIEDVAELPMALRWVSRLAPAVIFAEDIDRISDGDRDHNLDVLLNTLDGVDTKQHPILTILTSNYPENIYKGMVRPGRIDVALQIDPPDAAAAVRLVKSYLKQMYDDRGDEDSLSMGQCLAGMIPAVISEVCKRARLSSISRTGGGAPGAGSITSSDVLRAAGSMNNQIKLLNGPAQVNDEDALRRKIVDRLVGGLEFLEASSTK